MLANSREELVEVFDALDAELDRLDEVSFEVLTTPERLRSLERLECLVRRLPAVGHTLINQLDTQASEEELGGTLCCALANRLRITKPDAALRIADAADLGPRRALTGEPLAPQLTATATAQRQGLIGEAHIKVIRALFRPPARRGGCVHPPGRRSRPGRQSRSSHASSRASRRRIRMIELKSCDSASARALAARSPEPGRWPTARAPPSPGPQARCTVPVGCTRRRWRRRCAGAARPATAG